MAHHGFRLSGAGALAIAGGLLMVTSGVATHSVLLPALGIVEGQVPHYIGGIAGLTVTVAIEILALLIGLGGLTVIFGGIFFLRGHRTSGRLLITLGGASGFLGLLITFGYASYRLGLSGALSTAPYWLGVLLAVLAGRLAKGA